MESVTLIAIKGLAFLTLAFLVMLFWNGVMPVLGVAKLNYSEAVLIYALSNLLFNKGDK